LLVEAGAALLEVDHQLVSAAAEVHCDVGARSVEIQRAFDFGVDSARATPGRGLAASAADAQRYGGWSRLLTLGVQSFTVPGTHVSMCEEPNM
jgi:hypothetical protein